MAEDRMLSDEVLLALINKNSGGGGGGTSNYNDLSNKPQIGGNTLVGNKTASDLGLVAAENGKGLSSNDYTNEDKAIVGGVTAALAGKQGVLTAGNYVSITNDGTINVTQGIGVYDVYSYELMSTGVGITIQLTKKINNVTISTQDIRNEDYSPTNKLTVDGLFELWYDMSNFYWHYKLLVDSEEHQKNEDINWYYRTMADYTETFDVSQDSSTDLATKGDVDTALADKQDKTDNSLQTTDKTVVGAINENAGDISSLKSGLTNLGNIRVYIIPANGSVDIKVTKVGFVLYAPARAAFFMDAISYDQGYLDTILGDKTSSDRNSYTVVSNTNIRVTSSMNWDTAIIVLSA